jgi:DNA primase
MATLSTSGLCSVILPPEVKTVIVAADGDEGGEEAAQAAARRFIAEGRKVKIARPPQGLDFNNVLLGRSPGFEEGVA